MAGKSLRLINNDDTYDRYGHERYYQTIVANGYKLQSLHLSKKTAAAATSKTEIGGAITTEFLGSDRESFTITTDTRVNTPGSSYFTFSVINSSEVETDYYAYFTKKEVFTIVCDTRVNIPGSSSFSWQDSEGTPTTYYGYFTKKEVVSIQCLDAASTTTGTYFTITDSEAAPTSYYVWMDKNGDGSTDDPSPAGGATGVACNISAATTADDIATIVAAALDALVGFGASATTNTVTVTMATKGDPTDAADVDTGYTVSVTEQGGEDPTGTGTGVEFDISASATADDVGTVIATAIDALGGTGASNTTGTVTVTMATKGDPTDAADIDSGLTITVTEQGGEDPSPTGPTGVECDISASITAANVATVVQTALNGLSDLTATVSTATVTAEVDNEGHVTDATDVDSGVVIVITNQGNTSNVGAQVWVVSSSANDNDIAAGHVRKVSIIGYRNVGGSDLQLDSEEINMKGTTRVGSTYTDWIRIINFEASDWGTGGSDAAGNITLTDFDGTNTFYTITAGDNTANGGRIYIPNGFRAYFRYFSLDLATEGPTAQGDGVIFYIDRSGLDFSKNNRIYNTDGDNVSQALTVTNYSPYLSEDEICPFPLIGSDTGKITLLEADVANAAPYCAQILIWIWKVN